MGTPSYSGFPSTIPDWMLLFSFSVALLWTVVRLIELLIRIFRGSCLDFKLTKEIFLRLLEQGECFFAHGVFISYYGGVLIGNIEATLRKENGSKKEFPLEIVQFGEKYRGDQGLSQYYFQTTSPLEFVSENDTKRPVFLCALKTYSDSLKKISYDFQSAIIKYKTETDQQIKELSQEEMTVILNGLWVGINKLIDDTHARIMDNVQIEPGNYELSMKIKYKTKGKIVPSYTFKEVSSAINYKIDNTVRDQIRWQLRRLLLTYALNILLNKSEPLFYPEYAPIEVEEKG